MREMLLDRDKNAPVPFGYQVVTSEIEFLRHATDSLTPMQVRGASLCDWAGLFFKARQVPFREVLSAVRELQASCQGLSPSQATEIYERLRESYCDLPRPLAVPALLTVLYPNRLWSDEPSMQHAAQWLLWLHDQKPDEAVLPLLDTICEHWRRQADVSERIAYAACDADAALAALDHWLGIVDEAPATSPGLFPLAIPTEFKNRARLAWKRTLVNTRGGYFTQLNQRSLPPTLKQIAAQEAAGYFKAHPEDLTEERMAQLAPHLSVQEQSDLRKWLHPSLPSRLPDTVGEVLSWFGRQYLPYRFWQATSGDQAPTAVLEVEKLAHQFALWYLDYYPRALMGDPLRNHLSFARAGFLAASDPHSATLLVVLDGLHVADAHHLQLAIQRLSPRLALTADEFAFAPIPTVTEFCKDALFRAVPPHRVKEKDVSPIGEILPESVSPVDRLRSARPNRLYIWRVLEPDNTYHWRNGYDTLQREVEAQLDGIAAKIADIVEEVPAEVSLRIVITTDHGRLLARSIRKLGVPSGMKSHGRAAWGSTERSYPASGYILEDNVVYLHGERFGLPCEAAVAFGEEAFLTSDGKSGSELYPHGGLFPEEVIIPWIEYARDVDKPLVEIKVQGKGQANKQGRLEVQVVNLSDIPVTLTTLSLGFGTAGKRLLTLDWQVAPQSSGVSQIDLAPWPSTSEIKAAYGTVQLRQPNGYVFDADVRVQLKSEEMYSRDDILEGFDL